MERKNKTAVNGSKQEKQMIKTLRKKTEKFMSSRNYFLPKNSP